MQDALIDTHCHLDAHYFPEGPAAVMARARAAGVRGFVVIGVGDSPKPARDALALAAAHPREVAATVGVHPHDARTVIDEQLQLRAALAEDYLQLMRAPELVAVGETGLDYHYDHSPRAQQKRAFAWQIECARILRKPLVVHTRSAAQDTLDILAQENAKEVGGIIHCFSEDWAFAERALELNFMISFSGIVTFKNAKAIQEVAQRVPSDKLLLETDSPYLAPVPHRGKSCEPAMLQHTASKVAELRGVSLAQLAAESSANAERLFARRFG